MQAVGMEIRTIKVRTLHLKDSDLMMAISDELKGLMVPGRNHEELRRKLPAAITELLEATGVKVMHVAAEDDDVTLPKEFHTPGFLAKAELESVA